MPMVMDLKRLTFVRLTWLLRALTLKTTFKNTITVKNMAVLVGKPAPDFSATAVVNGGDFEDNYTLSQFKGKKYVVLFFYPLDFTFVCPTEIVAFQDKLAEFEKRDAQVIGVSVDS